MGIIQDFEYRIGKDTLLVVAVDEYGWWHCLAYSCFETDYIGPFDTRTDAVQDAKATYLGPEWAEMGWDVNPVLLDAVPVA